MTLNVTWADAGREPQCPPNPDHPNGVNLVLAKPGDACCSVSLPYPAKRCGAYYVECTRCGKTAVVTTAGRPDDQKSLRLACKPPKRRTH